MRIALFGTFDAARHPRATVLQQGLIARGHEVVVVNAPLGLDTAFRVALLRRPWLAFTLLARLFRCWSQLWRRSRRLDVDAVVIGYLGHVDVHLARARWRHTPLALDHLVSLADTARDRGLARPWSVWGLELIDRLAVRAADLVLIDTEEHRDVLPNGVASRAMVVPVGAPDAWFAEPVRRDSLPVQVVFFGLYTPLQGAPTIGRTIALLGDDPRFLFTMVGTGQDLDLTRAQAGSSPYVTWLDWVATETLPAFVANQDVCLGIFGTGPKAQRVVPNKVFQGAAAGCAIVTSDTAPQRRVLGDAARFVAPGDPGALADALGRLAADPDELWRARQAAHALARSTFTPMQVVAPLESRLAEVVSHHRG